MEAMHELNRCQDEETHEMHCLCQKMSRVSLFRSQRKEKENMKTMWLDHDIMSS